MNASMSECAEELSERRSWVPALPRSDADSTAQLLRTIETEIIPRLMLAHQAPPAPSLAAGEGASSDPGEDVREFARLVVTHDVAIAAQFIEALLKRGLTLESVYLELLTPAARLLGEWWKEDLRNFAQVTSGLCRMHQLLHGFSRAFAEERPAPHAGRRVLLTPMPGEQHTFGLIMVGEFFRRDGWEVSNIYPQSRDDLRDALAARTFDVVGISLSCASRMEESPAIVQLVRKCVRERAIGVMIGGSPFTGHPELALAVGADATASDGQQAVLQALKLTHLLSQQA